MRICSSRCRAIPFGEAKKVEDSVIIIGEAGEPVCVIQVEQNAPHESNKFDTEFAFDWADVP